MKRATGGGTIEFRPVESTPTEELFGFSLTNFDIEDATLKSEHKAFIEEVVPLLTSFAGVGVVLQGMTSRTGAAGFNQKLSEQRVEAVAKHINEIGVSSGKVRISAVGERAAQAAGDSEKNENPRFRAVLMTFRVPKANRPPRFDRKVASEIEDGFDNSLVFEPPSVLVRMEDVFREVRLLDGRGLTLTSTNPRVIRAEDPTQPGTLLTRAMLNPQLIRLQTTGQEGAAEIQARNGAGRIVTRLRVSVVRRLTVRVAFHYVRNPRRTPGIGTSRTIGREAVFIEQLDTIYRPQANIEFDQVAPPRVITVTENLGREVTVIDGDDTEFNIVVKQRNPAAQFNVFFVRAVEKSPEGTRDKDGDLIDEVAGVTTLGDDGDCIFEDDVDAEEGNGLAHEAGHCLGIDHDDPVRSSADMLMFPDIENGSLIPHVVALRMRRNVRRP